MHRCLEQYSQFAMQQADLFGAGTDTSLNTISWALLLLSSPDQAHLVQALQAEIFEECGEEGEIHLGLRLPLLRATILEVTTSLNSTNHYQYWH